MSETPKVEEEKIDYTKAGWGFLMMILMASIVITFVMMFFGGEWYWPVLFFSGLILTINRYREGNSNA